MQASDPTDNIKVKSQNTKHTRPSGPKDRPGKLQTVRQTVSVIVNI